MIWSLLFAATADIAPVPPPIQVDVAAVLTGRGEVVDGDGITFGDVEVRLQGIAAPEWGGAGGNHPGGRAARDALARLIGGRPVLCELDGTTASSNRPVGICYVDGQDVGEVLVAQGHARDCPRYSQGRYAEVERQAKAQGSDLSRIYDLPGYCRP